MSSAITRLDAASVKQLCSGQVITTLASVVKELVENSLDAEARTVDVVLENFGLDGITVTDDGHGIAFDGDVPLLSQRASSKTAGGPSASLGFRGEALHSLAHTCAQVAIHSLPAAAGAGGVCATLAFDYAANKATLTTPTPAGTAGRRDAPGTTVVARGLFQHFPVRRRELEKNKKKQLLAAAALLRQYALCRPDVRIIVTHRDTSAVPPAASGVATAAAAPAAVPSTVLLSTSGSRDVQRSVGEAYGGRVLADAARVEWKLLDGAMTLAGYVSRVGHGRATGDMQVFALDGRPVDLPKLARTIADVFASCHPSAAARLCPAFFLRVSVATAAAPMIAYDVNLSPDKRQVLLEREDAVVEALREAALQLFRTASDAAEVGRERPRPSTSMAGSFSQLQQPRSQQQAISTFAMRAYAPRERRDLRAADETPAAKQPRGAEDKGDDDDDDDGGGFSPGRCDVAAAVAAPSPEDDVAEPREFVLLTDRRSQSSSGDLAVVAAPPPRQTVVFADLDELCRTPLHPAAAAAEAAPAARGRKRQRTVTRLNQQTDEELNLVLPKSAFPAMTIHGQFNHGFIVASSGGDMFVIDQHAADEKHTYEHLMATYVPRAQPLVKPVSVPIDVLELELALQHAAELKAKHGFVVSAVASAGGEAALPADDTGAAATALLVSAVPVLRYDTVAPQDVLELTAQLVQYGRIVRPLRAVWHSLATRACRSSIMIGTALSAAQMRQIVSRMGTMDQPWNCPHGRPTLRHVAIASQYPTIDPAAEVEEEEQ